MKYWVVIERPCTIDLISAGLVAEDGHRQPPSRYLSEFVAVREVAYGPARHLMRCSEMSGVEVKADSKSMASFGRF